MPTITRMVNNLQVSLGKINNFPSVGLNLANPLATVHIVAPANNIKTVIVQGTTGQIQDPFEVQNVGGNTLFGVSAAGNIAILGTLTVGSSAIALTDATGNLLTAALPIVDVPHGGLGVSSLSHAYGIITAGATTTSPVLQLYGSATGQILAWDNTTLRWTIQTPTGGGNVSSNTSGATSTTGNIVKWLGTNLATDSVMTEYTGGLIGINKATPTAKLHVKSSSVSLSTLTLERTAGQTADLFKLVAEDGTTPIMSIGASGNTGLGGAAYSNGLVTISGTLATTGYDLYGWNGNGFTLSPDAGHSAYFTSIGGTVGTSAGVTNPNAYGQYIGVISKTGTGTVTNAYGLYVGLPTAGTSNYAAYFDGQVAIGATFGNNMLLSMQANIPLLTGANSYGIYTRPTLNPDNAQTAYGMQNLPIVNISGSNTANIIGMNIGPIVKTGSGTATTVTGLIVNAQTAATTNYSADLRGIVGIGGGTYVPRADAILGISNVNGSPTYAGQQYGVFENVTLLPSAGQKAYLYNMSGTIGASTSSTLGEAYGLYISPPIKPVSSTDTIPTVFGIYIDTGSAGGLNYSAYFSNPVSINTRTGGTPETSIAAMFKIVNNNSSNPIVINQAAVSQSAVMEAWNISTGATVQYVNNDGTLGITPVTTANPLIQLKNIASPTQNFIQWQNSSGITLGVVNPSGYIGIGNSSPAYPLDIVGSIHGTTNIAIGDVPSAGTTAIFSGTFGNGVTVSNAPVASNGMNYVGLNVTPIPNVPTGVNASTLYGQYTQLNKTGTGTISVGYGLFVSSSSGVVTTYYPAVFLGGNVGIGTQNPGAALEVVGQTKSTSLWSTSNAGIGTAPNVGILASFYGPYATGLYINNNASLPASIVGMGIELLPSFIVGSGVVSGNGYGLHIQPNKSGTGVMGTMYGIFVDSVTATAPAPNYYPAVFLGGNVGIGISAPQYTLDVNGLTRTGNIGINTTPLSYSSLFIGGSVNSSAIYINNTEVISSNGLGLVNVDIKPVYTAASPITGGSSYAVYIEPQKSGTGNIGNLTGIYVNSVSSSGPAPTNYYPAVFMGGNVGISTANPSYLLHVNGTLGVGGTSTLSGIANTGTISTTNLNASSYSAFGGGGLNGQVAVSIGGNWFYGINSNPSPILAASGLAYGGSFGISAVVSTGVVAAQLFTLGAAGGTVTGGGTVQYTYGVIATSTTTGTLGNYAIYTNGDVVVAGTLSKTAGTFLIDHPLMATEKDLRHGFVEAPQYDLIYRGTATLKYGKADIDIDEYWHMTPGTFAALNQNIQYFVTNDTGWEPVRVINRYDGKFTIVCKDETSTDTVVWMVIGERADAYVKHSSTLNTDDNGHLIVEEEKKELTKELHESFLSSEGHLPTLSNGLKGYHRNPEAFGMARHSAEDYREKHGLERTLTHES